MKGLDSGAGSPGDRNEFVEIYNKSNDTINLNGYSISDFDATDVIIPWTNESLLIKYPRVRINSSLISPNTYAVILDPEYISGDTVGGYCQLYNFPDSTLILTIGNTTIGDGLSTNDPIIIYSSADSCTTSFGTPSLEDGFPYDPGDGISWERIDLEIHDSINNWYPSIDSSGCTPGRENSTTNAYDLGLSEDLVSFVPAVVKLGEDVNIRIGIVNYGLHATNDYKLIIFEDLNNDNLFNSNELITELSGEHVSAFDTVFLFYTLKRPEQGGYKLGFLIDYTQDKELSNNLLFRELKVLGEIGELAIYPAIFTPNNDGKDDYLQIDYRLPEVGGDLAISIFNTRGRRLGEIYKERSISEDKGTIYWNGELGSYKAPTGMYIVYLEYRYKNKLTSAKKVAVLAR